MGSPNTLYSNPTGSAVDEIVDRMAADLQDLNPDMVAIGIIIGRPLPNNQYHIAILPIGEKQPKVLGEILISLGVEMLKGPAVTGGGKPQ